MLKQCGRRANLKTRRLAAWQRLALTGFVATIAVAALAIVHGPTSRAADYNGNGIFVSEGASAKRVVVTIHKSRTFNVQRPFVRAIPGAADIADVLPLSDRSIYVQGKKIGTTNVSLIDAEGRLLGILDLEVAPDVSILQEKIRSTGASQGIRVSSAQGQIVLSGVAADAVAADRAVRVAKSFAGDAEIVNAMTVAPSQQVMLEVRFLEVTRDAGRQLPRAPHAGADPRPAGRCPPPWRRRFRPAHRGQDI